MDYFDEIFARGAGYVEVINAFCFSPDFVYVLLEARDEDEELEASALLKVPMSDPMGFSTLDLFDYGSLDYHAEDGETHFVLAQGEFLRLTKNGEFSFHHFVSTEFEMLNLAGIDRNRVMVFGQDGRAYQFQDGAYAQVPTHTDGYLNAMHIPKQGKAYAGGNFGVFLEGSAEALTPVEIGSQDFIQAVHVTSSGLVLLGCDDGMAMTYDGDELVRMEGYPSGFRSVGEFRGVEYWGDDEFGIYARRGQELEPVFETTYAFQINTTQDLMTVNAGYRFYVFNGKDWAAFRVNPDPVKLIERIPLDFTPS